MNEEEYHSRFKILIIGDSGVGKSTLLLGHSSHIYSDCYEATRGVDVKVSYKTVKLQIWDTAGSPNFRTIVEQYYPVAHGALICFDLTNTVSFNNTEAWVKRFRALAVKDAPIILVGCKADLVQQRTVDSRTAKAMADALGLIYFETSSLAKINVNEPFDCIGHLFFLTELTTVRPRLEAHFNNYVKLGSQNNRPGLFSTLAQSLNSERPLRDEYQINFDHLFRSTSTTGLDEFLEKTVDIIKRANRQFRSDHFIMDLVDSSPLSKTLKQILADLCSVSPYIAARPYLKEAHLPDPMILRAVRT